MEKSALVGTFLVTMGALGHPGPWGSQVKRVATIFATTVLVLVMTTGSAFALSCTSASCAKSMSCSSAVAMPCPMQGAMAMLQSICDHDAQRLPGDVATTQRVADPVALAGTTAPAVTLATLAAPAAPPPLDARGAPHLTAVIRI